MNTVIIENVVKRQNKQEIIRQVVSEKIRNGEYGEKLPSVRELAKNFSVNVITLRKALSPLVGDGVIYTEKGKGIYINSKKRTCIGIIGSTHEKSLFDKGEYFGDIFSGMLENIEKNNDFFSYQSKQRNRTYLEIIRENSSVAGLVIFAPGKAEENELRDIIEKIPFIVVGTTTMDKTFNCIDSDNYNDSMEAVRKLIKEGNKRILFLSDRLLSRTHDLRYKGYIDALSECGIEYDKKMIITENPGENSFSDRVIALWGSVNPPDAIFAASNYAAFKLLEIDDVRPQKNELIVYDDPKDILSRFGIEYRVIQQPLYEIGKLAIKKLYDLIQNKNMKPEQIKLSSKLITKKRENVL